MGYVILDFYILSLIIVKLKNFKYFFVKICYAMSNLNHF